MMKKILLMGPVLLFAASASAADMSSGRAMAQAATRLLSALDETQRSEITYAFDAGERVDFHFVPKANRKGVSIKDMSPVQLHLTHALLNESLSRSGYTKAAGIMSLEAVLAELENARTRRDPMKYHVTLFGDPESDETWGWSFEGHHLSLNFTVAKGNVVASSPAFLGANPHQVLQGPMAGLRVLGEEEDRARHFLASLNPDQLARAVIDPQAPQDILSGARPRVSPGEPRGLPASALTHHQFALLRALVDTYIDTVPSESARERRDQFETAGSAIHFAWMGSVKPGDPHYYRIQGPAFLVEYDNIQNGANHAHTVWRDFHGDFGRDLMGEHRTAHSH